MKILTIDSAMNGCSAGIYDTETLNLTDRSLQVARGQAEVLMPLISEVVDVSGIDYSMLDLIAVTRGPGAFTGMRIGLATAKALGLAAAKPVCGVTTFDAILETYLLSHENIDVQAIGILLETKRKDFYFQIFDGCNFSPISEPAALSGEDVCKHIAGYRNIIIVGDAGERFNREVEAFLGSTSISYVEILQSSAMGIARAVEAKCKAGVITFDETPCYLRGADVSMSKKQARILQ